MSTGRLTESPGRYTDLNLVPMIDILLVLVIIFMLQRLTVMVLHLPAPSTSQPLESGEIVLSIDAAGNYILNSKPIVRDSLDAELRSILRGRPQTILFIHPDRQLSYRDVVAAMDMAKGTGVELSLLLRDP